MNEIKNGNHTIDVDNLINRTQKEDVRNQKMMKGVFILYVICTVFYAALLLFNPDPDLTLIRSIGRIVLCGSLPHRHHLFPKGI